MVTMFENLERTRLLAVSPHLDDAVLSFGAGLSQLVRGGAKATVFTAFAGTAAPPYSPAAERMHTIWGLSPNDDAPSYRRKEDIAALNHLGVAYRHGRFLDSIYRKLPDDRWLADHVAGGAKLAVRQQSLESNRDLVSAIKDDLKSVIEECEPTLIATCAAIGDHPDHEMARDAALFAAAEKDIPIRLWQDLPYAALGSSTVTLPKGFQLGPPDFSAVQPDARTRKFQALEYYTSQLLMLSGPGKDLFAQLADHARKISTHGGYGEMTWPVTFR